ncbi:hypothetical protein F5Y11DRAFT_82864 [Daldinia sp. FL1419]|nr:hypothetical protein F5Y11DRAFT_82864 [Daldinia sp. FL1419]
MSDEAQTSASTLTPTLISTQNLSVRPMPPPLPPVPPRPKFHRRGAMLSLPSLSRLHNDTTQDQSSTTIPAPTAPVPDNNPQSQPQPKDKGKNVVRIQEHPKEGEAPALPGLLSCPCTCHDNTCLREGRPWVGFSNAAYVVCPLCWVEAYTHAHGGNQQYGYECEEYLRRSGFDPRVAPSKQRQGGEEREKRKKRKRSNV